MAKKKILYVDSAWQVEDTTGTVIEIECNAEVVVAETFEEAEANLNTMQFDLVISAVVPADDHISDGIINTGLDFIRSLELPVIIICSTLDFEIPIQPNPSRQTVQGTLESFGIPKERMFQKPFGKGDTKRLVSLINSI